ncbi:MAG: glycosyltransferase family A protein [Silvibacterium sp.]
MSEPQFPLVSALFITWRRFDLLKPTVESFLRNTNYPNLELVIADDGSEPAVQALIRTLPAQHFSLPPSHRGLGANNNNGLGLCTGKYIFMIQDDWLCHGPSDYLRNTVAVLEANPDVGIINFAGAPHPPDYTLPLNGSAEACYVTPIPFQASTTEQFLYSDQPHIQTRAALDSIGPYKEDRDMEACEIDYNYRWGNQKLFGTAVFPAYYMRVFTNEGEARSFRTNLLRYRVQRALLPLKPALEGFSPVLFQRAKSIVQWTIRRIERMRLRG